MRTTFWTEGRIKQLRQRAAAGYSTGEVAEEFGISKGWVSKKASELEIRFNSIKRLGLTVEQLDRVRELIAKGYKWREIADEMGKDPENLRKFCCSRGIRIAEARKKKPIELRRIRKCLMHGGEFTPEHRHEFVCASCKATKTWRESQVQLI